MAGKRQTRKPGRRRKARPPETPEEAEQRRAQERIRKTEQRRRASEGLALFKFKMAFNQALLEDALVGAGAINPSVADDRHALEKALEKEFAEFLKKRLKISG